MNLLNMNVDDDKIGEGQDVACYGAIYTKKNISYFWPLFVH